MASKPRVAPPLAPELLQTLARTMTPVDKNAQPVFKSNELGSVFSVSSPALGRFSSHGVRAVRRCCEKRGLNSRAPQAFRVLTGQVPGIIALEPLDLHDPHAGDQYPINWFNGNRIATVALLPVFQPLGLEVPPGHVAEMLITCEELPGSGHYLLLLTADAEMREERKGTRRRRVGNQESNQEAKE